MVDGVRSGKNPICKESQVIKHVCKYFVCTFEKHTACVGGLPAWPVLLSAGTFVKGICTLVCNLPQ